jgi:phosphatidate cytidylyltransferase
VIHPIIYYILIFLAIGGAGMALANRKAEQVVKCQRWLKYFTYIIFTGIVVASIFYHFFWILALLIVIASVAELVKVNYQSLTMASSSLVFSFLFFLLVAAGFILFSLTFNQSFLLFIYFQVLVFDGFCQITGQLFGKHPLAPAISPSKTWEGFLGGWFFCCVAALLAANWVPFDFTTALLFGLSVGLMAFAGDMLASWYKRKVRVKDYSNWLPGQGGFLDRFDSLLITGALCYLLYITIFKNSFGELLIQGK